MHSRSVLHRSECAGPALQWRGGRVGGGGGRRLRTTGGPLATGGQLVRTPAASAAAISAILARLRRRRSGSSTRLASTGMASGTAVVGMQHPAFHGTADAISCIAALRARAQRAWALGSSGIPHSGPPGHYWARLAHAATAARASLARLRVDSAGACVVAGGSDGKAPWEAMPYMWHT